MVPEDRDLVGVEREPEQRLQEDDPPTPRREVTEGGEAPEQLGIPERVDDREGGDGGATAHPRTQRDAEGVRT